MKKTILMAVCFILTASFAFAQSDTTYTKKKNAKVQDTTYQTKGNVDVEKKNSKFHGTVMSKPNKVDYGFYYGYGAGRMANTGGLVLDINCAKNNYRTRIAIEGMERWYWVGASVQAQYLIPIVGGLYLYPSVGIRGEIHDVYGWRKEYCDKHNIEYDPNAKWGPGSWGIGGDFGGGLEYQFCPYVALFAEGKYSVMYNTNHRWQANIGLTFHFGKGHREVEQ